MADLESLLPRVTSRASQTPEPVAISAIRDTVIELCEKARVWPFRVVVTLTEDEAEEIPVPAGSALHEIETVRYDGRRLEPRILYDMEDRFSAINTPGAPAYYSQMLGGSIIVKPPAPGAKIEIRGFLKPILTATAAPDFVINQHHELIADGALSRLLTIPGQAWSNPQLGAYHGSLWQRQLDHILAGFLQGQQNAPLRTRPQFF